MKRANRLGLACKYQLGASCHVCFLSQLQRVRDERAPRAQDGGTLVRRSDYRPDSACGASRKLSPPIVTHTSSRGTS